MSTTITGVGSGFDIDGWVSSLVSSKKTSTVTPLEEKLSTLNSKNSAISSLESKFSTLKNSLQTFTKVLYDSSSDFWNNNTITSSNSTYATATSSGSVQASNINLEIEQIATSTVAKSVNLGSQDSTDVLNMQFSNIANEQAKEGDFSMFVDGKQYTVNIKNDDTISDIVEKINNETNGLVTAKVTDDGDFEIYTDKDHTFSLGSSADTSNFSAVLKLNTKLDDDEFNGYKNSYAISTLNTYSALTDENTGLKGLKITGEDNKGTITINGEEFEINNSTTLNQLITSINANSDANVKASYDSLTNKFMLTSTQTGENNISLSEEETNLLQVLGLTEIKTIGDSEEEVLKSGSQELGQNAIAYVNGNKVISTSNTITGESSGISNLSITIKKQTSKYIEDEDESKNAEKNVTLDIEKDYSEVTNALETFISAYNDVVTTTKSQTSSSGTIGTDSSLTSILSKIRGITSQTSENKGIYTLLSDIGISTSNSDPTKLSLDKTKLQEALDKNYESVKYLISDGYKDEKNNGLFDKLLDTVSSALDTEKGYFTQRSDTIQSQITRMNERIERANKQLTNYQTRITNQFNKMDSTINSLNAQLTSFSSIIS